MAAICTDVPMWVAAAIERRAVVRMWNLTRLRRDRSVVSKCRSEVHATFDGLQRRIAARALVRRSLSGYPALPSQSMMIDSIIARSTSGPHPTRVEVLLKGRALVRSPAGLTTRVRRVHRQSRRFIITPPPG